MGEIKIKNLKLKINKGFTLLEIIVSMAIAALILPALGSVFTFALNSSSVGDKTTSANIKAQEQLEAIYYLKEKDWDSVPVNTSSTAYYQLDKSSGDWVLSAETTTPASVDGYVSTVQVFSVARDGAGNLQATGTIDPDTKKMVSKVTWVDKEQEEVTLSSYVTKH